MTIELKGVQFAHSAAPQKQVLSITEWSVAEGEQVFVHGPSGSGKSTLLNLISGLLHCTEGDIRVLGDRLNVMSSRQRDRFRANHIGYVFQRFNLIPYLSAIENIELARSFASVRDRGASNSTSKFLLQQLNVESSQWKKPTSQLSTGQQQRVAIARALVNHPEVLIADEPTSSLDLENRDNFMSVLMPIVQEHRMTLLFVSHDMSLATHFSRVQGLNEISTAV